MQTNLQNRDRLDEAELFLGQATRAGGSATDDRERRRNLAASDELLNQIEEMRLADRVAVPTSLRNRIGAFAAAVGYSRPIDHVTSLRTAHRFVLALQHRLMASNPRSDRPQLHPRFGEGQPITVRVATNAAWKLLTLPTVPDIGPTGEWLVIAADIIERAWDRWAWAQHHAVAAARCRVGASAAVRRAIVAWANYWSLCEELDRVRGLAP